MTNGNSAVNKRRRFESREPQCQCKFRFWEADFKWNGGSLSVTGSLKERGGLQEEGLERFVRDRGK